MLIRPATEADAGTLADIYNPYILETRITAEETPVTAEEFKGRIRKVLAEGYPYLVATEEDGEVLGYAYAQTFRARAAFRHTVESAIYLDQSAAGKGAGTLLYGTLLAELQRLKVHAVIAVIPAANPVSEALHRKMGFEKMANFREVAYKFSEWYDVGYWELLLGNE